MIMYDTVAYLETTDFDGGMLKPSLADKKLYVVMIFSSNCGHCKVAMPEYKKMADSMKDDNVVIACIENNGSKPTEKGWKFDEIVKGFKGFPTIVAFKGGKIVDTFQGGERSSKKLTEFVQKNK